MSEDFEILRAPLRKNLKKQFFEGEVGGGQKPSGGGKMKKTKEKKRIWRQN